MARIVHIALKVDDLEKATEFYEKGFGFVEMKTDKEAQAAIAGLNGKDTGGRTLTVNEARPKTERPRGDSGGRRY